jgi:hypothetical protein
MYKTINERLHLKLQALADARFLNVSDYLDQCGLNLDRYDFKKPVEAIKVWDCDKIKSIRVSKKTKDKIDLICKLHSITFNKALVIIANGPKVDGDSTRQIDIREIDLTLLTMTADEQGIPVIDLLGKMISHYIWTNSNDD